MRRARKVVSNEDGAAALEFALVSFPFLAMIFFIMFVGLTEFLSMQIDYAMQKAARQVMIGTIQTKAVTQAQFRTNYICVYLPVPISCNDVIVNLQTIQEAAQPKGYYQLVDSNANSVNIPQLNNSATSFSPGSQGSYEYLQIIYPVTFLPSFISKMLSGGNTYNGSPAFLLISTIAFRNESY